MTATTAPRSTRMTADERRAAVVTAGLEEFALHGLAGASTDAIARRAGVSQPYVFQLFGTKKDLFLAVVRDAFARTRIAFEEAARRQEAGVIDGCNTILDAMGRTYHDLLHDRMLLLIQLQAYAACWDPDVRAMVRDEWSALYRFVREASGASTPELHDFFATGMLLNVAAAVDLEVGPDAWPLDAIGGEA